MTLSVACLPEHRGGRFAERALVRHGDFQHRVFSFGGVALSTPGGAEAEVRGLQEAVLGARTWTQRGHCSPGKGRNAVAGIRTGRWVGRAVPSTATDVDTPGPA